MKTRTAINGGKMLVVHRGTELLNERYSSLHVYAVPLSAVIELRNALKPAWHGLPTRWGCRQRLLPPIAACREGPQPKADRRQGLHSQKQPLTGGRVSFGLPRQHQYHGLRRLLPINIAGAAGFAGPPALVFSHDAGFDRCFAKRLSRIFTIKPRERKMLELDWVG